ncbi:MAG: hypothetical protein OXC63_01985 [Aestuariivita sp.]|nr:hypothetical protein [Aestuariivita sp.]MCY4346600.1 hypothetical protein [Aestuariivita sp.]
MRISQANTNRISKKILGKRNIGDKGPECLIDIEVNYRHLVTGNHRIDAGIISQGQWALKDEKGGELGKLDVSSNMIKGLHKACEKVDIGVGTFIIIDFSAPGFEAVVIW